MIPRVIITVDVIDGQARVRIEGWQNDQQLTLIVNDPTRLEPAE